MLSKAMILISFPSLVLADTGSHFHPHGIEPVWVLMAVASALGAGILLGRWRR